MATRNLTKKYIELRNGAKANRSLHGGTFHSEDGDSGLLKVVFECFFFFVLI